MAVTVTRVLPSKRLVPDVYLAIQRIGLSNEVYATGGISHVPPVKTVKAAIFLNTNGYSVQYDSINKKIVFYSAAGTEVAASTPLTVTLTAIFIG